MARRRRVPVTITLAPAVMDGLRDLAERENRPVSREAERAIARHLAEQKTRAAS